MRISQSFRIGRVRLFASVPDGIGRLGVSAPVGRPKRKRAR